MSRTCLALAALLLVFARTATAQGDFTGFYGGIGAELGFHQEGLDVQIATVNGADQLDPHDAAGLSFLAGYTMMRGDWVLGAEAQVSIFSVDFSDTDCVIGAIPACADAILFGTRDNAVRLRGLVGQEIVEDTLLFATLGISASSVEISGTGSIVANGLGGGASAGAPGLPQDGTALGYTIGVGAERRMSERFSLRGDVAFERLFFDHTIGSGNLANLPPSFARTNLFPGTMRFENVSFGVTAVFRF